MGHLVYSEPKGFYDYSAANIANYLLDLGKKEKISISCIKLNKLIYIVFGMMTLFKKDKYLFPDRIEAWQYGPVIPNIYHQFKYFGKYDINNKKLNVMTNSRAIDTDLTENGYAVKIDGMAKSINKLTDKTSKSISEAIKEIWDLYKNKKPFELVNLTHEKTTPWSDVYRERDNNDVNTFNIEIKKSLIARYYFDLLSLSDE